MSESGIERVRALLGSKPRPVGWQERRARIEEVGAVVPAEADVLLTPDVVGGVPCEWSIAPGSDPLSLLVYFHGGGFCSGSIRSHRRLVTEAGRAFGMRTLAVGYRLAPEHPFPAALDDARAVWAALLGQGHDPARIVVAGDSAGGGLSVALSDALRADGKAQPACLWLLSPWTDLTMSGATLVTREAADPLIHRAYLEELAEAYVPPSVARSDPRVSVLFADLRGLPPVLVQVGADETLLADSTRLAEAAGSANVAITLEVWPDMIHAFPLWNGILPQGCEALQRAAGFVRRCITASASPAKSLE